MRTITQYDRDDVDKNNDVHKYLYTVIGASLADMLLNMEAFKASLSKDDKDQLMDEFLNGCVAHALTLAESSNIGFTRLETLRQEVPDIFKTAFDASEPEA